MFTVYDFLSFLNFGNFVIIEDSTDNELMVGIVNLRQFDNTAIPEDIANRIVRSWEVGMRRTDNTDDPINAVFEPFAHIYVE